VRDAVGYGPPATGGSSRLPRRGFVETGPLRVRSVQGAPRENDEENNVQTEEGQRNPPLDVGHGAIDPSASLLGKPPLVHIERRRKRLLEFVDDLELHGVQISVGFDDAMPQDRYQNTQDWHVPKNAYSGAKWTLIPVETGHRFRTKWTVIAVADRPRSGCSPDRFGGSDPRS